ncbi:hypothetical protein Ocin01_16703 [Orchesella cincta]|uniref:Uncharacterized protein n=1 Tax=Orchesella cincta TaxID=48709 RepID=A0A1D2MAF8_ORCCI|nr:hypothetical protein Ocin01_16703 [Orchesella cincta]
MNTSPLPFSPRLRLRQRWTFGSPSSLCPSCHLLQLRSPHFPICPSSAYAQVPQVAYQQAIAAPVAVAQPIIRQQLPLPNKLLSQLPPTPPSRTVSPNLPAQSLLPKFHKSHMLNKLSLPPALSYGSIGYGYNGALAGGLIH